MPAILVPFPETLYRCPECDGLGFDDDRLCVTCHGNKSVTKAQSDAYLESFLESLVQPAELGDCCEQCGEPSIDLQAVEDSDPDTGYSDVRVICRDCRTGAIAAEANAHGGLRRDALEILGVEDAWLRDEPAKRPAARQNALPPAPEEAA